MTSTHVPVKGMHDNPNFHQHQFTRPSELGSVRLGHPGSQNCGVGKLPRLKFPECDGYNPKLWLSRCENYFSMYSVDPALWIPFATMSLTGAASRWFQSVEPKLKNASWEEFSRQLLERFGRIQRETLIRQLFHMRQTGTVTDYVDRFAELVDQLSAYDHDTYPNYYAIRFVDGLRDEVRIPIALHRPTNFDTAACLALLQEEVGDKKRDSKKTDQAYMFKGAVKGPHPLPVPPHRDRHSTPILSDEKAMCEGKSPEERLTALRAFCRAKGLCINCAEKWSRDHKCSPTVQLHMLQELLELFNIEDGEEVNPEPYDEQLFSALSQGAFSGTEVPRTMRMQGKIQGHDILILVDSGSSHTFASESVALNLLGGQQLESPVKVKVANGELLHYDRVFPQAKWSVDAYSFCSTLKVLPLHHFDMILGMDWLEEHSPMKVHWKLK